MALPAQQSVNQQALAYPGCEHRARVPVGGVFQAAHDAVVVMGADGLVRDWNPAAEAAFGFTRDEAMDREVAELIIPGALRDAHRNALERYLATGETTILDRRVGLTAVDRGGAEFPVELIGDGCRGIAIGDVCGKGPEAAGLTALARYTLRALAGRDPGIVLSTLNAMVVRDPALLPDQFVTVLFAVASRVGPSLSIDIATAGHPAPLVLRKDGSVQRVRTTGPLVGLTSGSEFPPASVVLEGGDCLVLYTDGLTDARAPQRILTDEELAELVGRGHGLDGERLAKMLEEGATADRDPRDDIAILVIEVERDG